jgi:hypothetical protein
LRTEKTRISKIRKEKGEATTNTKEIQGIIRNYIETYIPINLKILNKWTNFYILLSIQNCTRGY